MKRYLIYIPKNNLCVFFFFSRVCMDISGTSWPTYDHEILHREDFYDKKNRVIEKNRNFFSKFFRNFLKNVWRKEFRLQNFSFTLFFFPQFFSYKIWITIAQKIFFFLLSIISQTYEARNHKINHLHEHERMLGKQISDYDKKNLRCKNWKNWTFGL